MSAGGSAAVEAVRQGALADAHEQAAREARRASLNYEAAAASEKATARTLAPLAGAGYHLLADRGWPGSRSANVDMVVIGPSGVYIVDTKNWAAPTIAAGRVFRDQDDVTDDFDKLADLAWRTEAALAEVGLAPGEVHALVSFAGRKGIRAEVGAVELVGDGQELLRAITRRGRRLDQSAIDAVTIAALSHFPVVGSATPVVAIVPEPVLTPREEPIAIDEAPAEASAPMPSPADQPALVAAPEVQDILFESLMAEPIEDWMAFLHPDQAKLVRRSFNGPARIRGAAGTGKTVVGLHRAAYLARSNPTGKVLVTTYVRTLPNVLRNLFARLAPDLVDRVEFVSVHQLATRILKDRGITLRLNPVRTDLLFTEAWAETSAPLVAIENNKDYWREEVLNVIKGRGLTSLEDYNACARVGRNRRLLARQRADVWKLYAAYDRRLRAAGLADYEDLILSAELALRAAPLDGYSAVIVDEAQDLSCAMIRVLAAIAGDGADAFTLIGDGQQTIYPGGYVLAEAGISVAGRGVVMDLNYRNTAEILEAARSIVAGTEYTDIEGTSTAASAPTAPRHGVKPAFASFRSRAEHNAAMVARVRDAVKSADVSLGDLAVLCFTKRQCDEAKKTFADAGIRSLDLLEYDGKPTEALKIGTVKRSKGLEFKQVLVPWVPSALKHRRAGAADEPSASAERESRDRRELFVAITRARDDVWVGSVSF